MPGQHTATSSFHASGVITLLTDFGLSEPYVGIMKGVILTRCPTARLIDLTHQVPPFQSALAGFWLARSWQYFPPGTVHLAVVDPGVGTARQMVVLQADGHVFVAPDNGLLDAVGESAGATCWRSFSLADAAQCRLGTVSHTFHGRDVFAPLVAELVAGRLAIGGLGHPRAAPARQVIQEGAGRIVGADHFGNLITDLPAARLGALRVQAIQFREQQIPLYQTYGHAPQGALLALVNSWGTVEIAVAQGNAQQSLQAIPGEVVTVVEGDRP